jgi:3'-5' exoribonuclease
MKIKDLKENSHVQSFYLVKEKSLNDTKTGKKFINIELMDSTGQINGKVWDQAENFYSIFEVGDIVKVEASVSKYREKLQLSIARLRLVEENDNVSLEDLLPSTTKSVEAMFNELCVILSSVENKHIKELIDLFFSDEIFVKNFKQGIAAKEVHHNYLGGLLEHTLSIVKICDFFAKHYEDIDRDILLTSAFLHDIGKIRELDAKSFTYTVEGSLKGHIIIGIEMIQDKLRKLNEFPSDIQIKIEHNIVSHHGELEWGSPVVPKTREAIILHYSDNIDAKSIQVKSEIEKDKGTETLFTPYNRLLKRNIFKG